MPGIDAKLFDTPEMKRLALEALVRERVHAGRRRQASPHDRPTSGCSALFVTDPQFASLRNPDGSVNKDVLAAQGMSSETFAQRLRQDLSQRQVLQGVAGTGDRAGRGGLGRARRDVPAARGAGRSASTPRTICAKVEPTDAEIEAYYKDPANAAQFRAPEQASIEYVVLDLEALKKGITVPEDDLRKYYAENEKRYTAPEERRASHILIKADKDAPQAERDKAQGQGRGAARRGAQEPGGVRRARAARTPQDPGSAEKGGDLDFFGRGAMVKPFEDAAFALKPGEIERRRRERLRLPHHPGDRRARRREAAASSRCAPSSRTKCATSSRRSAIAKRPSSSPTWSTSSPTA